jgi:carboxyl-terminal processing protease
MLKKDKQNQKLIITIFVSLIVGIIIGVNFSTSFNNGGTIGVSNQNNLDLKPFWKVWETVNKDFVLVENIDSEKAIYGSIKGLITSLDDPHSDFMTPDEAKIFKGDLDQEIQGIGAEISLDDGVLTIITPLKNSPAEIAGLKPNDKIIAINGEDSTSLGLLEGIAKIRGAKGTKVTLTIYRESLEEPIDLTIIRDKISVESVTSELLKEDIYYVSINQFSNDTAKEFLKVVNDIILENPKGIILDLRNNGGGYLDIAVDILGEFFPANTHVLTVKTGAIKATETYKTNGAARLQDYKTVILINEGSASASEILAGAMQDLGKALILGKQSYGKGTVQEVVDFEDGSSLRLTIAQWLTPKNRDINKIGITPDSVVEITDETVDSQLNAAVKEILK